MVLENVKFASIYVFVQKNIYNRIQIFPENDKENDYLAKFYIVALI